MVVTNQGKIKRNDTLLIQSGTRDYSDLYICASFLTTLLALLNVFPPLRLNIFPHFRHQSFSQYGITPRRHLYVRLS